VMFLGFAVCFVVFQYERETDFTREKLDAVLNSYNYQLYKRTSGVVNLDSVVRLFIEDIPQKDLRVTIIAKDGKVLFDNDGIGDMDNHNNRSEIQKARMNNHGFAIRTSDSNGKKYFYSATNIGGTIYRSALPWDDYAKQMLAINKNFLYFMGFMVLLFFLILSKFTFSLGRTINRLRRFAVEAENGRIPKTAYRFPSDDLGDIAENIVSMYHRQQTMTNELSMERTKLMKHFKYSREGFATFTSSGNELLSNILFIQFVNIMSDAKIVSSEEALDVPEMETIRNFLEENIGRCSGKKRKVLRKGIKVDKDGKIFQIECILFSDDSYEISINDISKQEEENRMKRQLTQNVAHELKTPVSSIQGYLETIVSNPDLPKDKMRFFIDRCFSQSTRLTGLLRDISVLNRLDEASQMFEITEVNISELVSEIVKECGKEISEKNIKAVVNIPSDTIVRGNHSLLYSIFRNLLDNSIAYAGEGVTVNIDRYKEDDSFFYFSYSDDGVGIPQEHINRIFERFYRVDKGRSRKTGGTGLGLSIVKNGVNFHKGQISAKSSPDTGLTFFFTISKL
jgi:signal transduction histidine kinase